MSILGPDPCGRCGHDPEWHLAAWPRPCSKIVYRWIGGNSGPGMEIPAPCKCTGYTPKEKQMMPEPAAPQIPEPAADAADEVHQVLHDLAAAWEADHQALLASHAQWAHAIAASHATWRTELEQLSARLARAAGGEQDGGQP